MTRGTEIAPGLILSEYVGCSTTSSLASKHLLHFFSYGCDLYYSIYNMDCCHNLGETFFSSPYKKFAFSEVNISMWSHGINVEFYYRDASVQAVNFL